MTKGSVRGILTPPLLWGDPPRVAGVVRASRRSSARVDIDPPSPSRVRHAVASARRHPEIAKHSRQASQSEASGPVSPRAAGPSLVDASRSSQPQLQKSGCAERIRLLPPLTRGIRPDLFRRSNLVRRSKMPEVKNQQSGLSAWRRSSDRPLCGARRARLEWAGRFACNMVRFKRSFGSSQRGQD